MSGGSPRAHLLVAGTSRAWGEMIHGLRLAWELARRGDRIVILAPPAMAPLFEGTPFKYGRLEQQAHLVPVAHAIVRDQRIDDVILIDVATVYMHLKGVGADASFLSGFRIPVLGLDVWDLAATDMVWDLGAFSWTHSPHALDVTRRLVPVPITHPDRAGVYDGLPRPRAPSQRRDEVRAGFGVAEGERLVFFPTAAWQQASGDGLDEGVRRLTERFPAWIAHLVARLGPRVRLVHVGARPMEPLEAALGARYRHSPVLLPDRFEALLAASDLLLSFNASATTIGAAVAHGVPVLLGVNSIAAATIDEVTAALPMPPGPVLAAWLAKALPLHRFRVWPMGLYSFLEPVLRDNPYLGAFEQVEVLDEEAFVAAADALLWDPARRDRAREAQAAYLAAVRRLPSGADLVDRYLSGG